MQNQFRIKIFAKHFFGNIIFGRSQSTGQQNQIHIFFRIFNCFFNMLTVIVNRGYLVNFNSIQIKLFCNPCRICINNLPN